MSQGVVRFDIKKESFSHAVSLGCDVISDISSDGKGTVYIATDGNGVHFLSHKDQQVTRRFTMMSMIRKEFAVILFIPYL